MNVRAMAITLLCSAALAVAPSGRARAQDARAEARAHFGSGVELAKQEAYDKAVDEFQRAYELSPNFAVLFNLGMAYVALGRPVEAIDTLTRYLQEGAAKVPEARRIEVSDEIRKQEAAIAYVTIDAEPAGAAVRIDGRDIGKSPISDPMRVGAGRHEVEVSLEGHQPAHEAVVVAGQERRTLRVRLEANAVVAVAPALVPVEPQPAPSPAPAPEVQPSPVADTRSASDSGGGTQRIVAYVLGGVGVAAAIGAVATHFVSDGRYSDWQQEDQALSQPLPLDEANRRQSANDDLGRSIEALDTVKVTLGIGAGAFLAAGVVLWLTSDGSEEPSGVAVHVGPASLDMRAAF